MWTSWPWQVALVKWVLYLKQINELDIVALTEIKQDKSIESSNLGDGKYIYKKVEIEQVRRKNGKVLWFQPRRPTSEFSSLRKQQNWTN